MIDVPHDHGDEDTGGPRADAAPTVPTEILDRVLPISLAFRAAQSSLLDAARWDALALHAAGMRDAIRDARAAGRL